MGLRCIKGLEIEVEDDASKALMDVDNKLVYDTTTFLYLAVW